VRLARVTGPPVPSTRDSGSTFMNHARSPGLFMNEETEAGRVALGLPPRGRRSGPPESRPQLEELRSGEWVTEPDSRGHLQRQDPSATRVIVHE